MSGGITEMPRHERPLSEQFRIVAKEYADAESAASLLEELKTTTLEQRKTMLIAEQGDMPDSRAERIVKAAAEWEEFIREMCRLRSEANLLRLKLEYVRMRFTEWQAADANSRAEMRLTR